MLFQSLPWISLRSVLCLGALAISLPTVADEAAKKEKDAGKENWIQLFNGKDLSGWRVKITGRDLDDNYADTFRVEDGLLKVSYDGYEEFGRQFGHIFYHQPFSNYRLRVEYRFVGEQVKGGPGWAIRNSGLMLHGQSPETMTKDQEFPASIEVQLLGGNGKAERTSLNLCTPGTNVVMDGKLIRRHCISSKSKTYHGEKWVTALVEVRGNTVKHIDEEGRVVLSYTDPQLDDRDPDAQRLLKAGQAKMLRKGTISLQSESHPIEFRKVELLELDDSGEGAGGWVDLLAGGDLAKHWETEGNWKLEDGVVSLTPRPDDRGWARFADYLWLKGEYGDFEFEFDYRVEPKGNSGFYFNVGDRKSPVRKGIEVQIFDSSRKGPDATLTDHDSGGIIPRIPPTKNAVRAPGEWNHFFIRSAKRKLTVKLNGEVVNEVDLEDPRLKGRPPRGAIGFQDHALPLALRKLRVRRL